MPRDAVGTYGFSVGIDDVRPGTVLSGKKVRARTLPVAGLRWRLRANAAPTVTARAGDKDGLGP